MSSAWGSALKLAIFGESRGKGIGAVIEGLPAGLKLNKQSLASQMARRQGGQSDLTTSRKEEDNPLFLSGIMDNILTGAPVALFIENKDCQEEGVQDSADCLPRPSHADYPAYIKYGGYADLRGGGMFSGRLTAALVAAGSLARDYLASQNIAVGSHVCQAGSARDILFDRTKISPKLLNALAQQSFPTLSESGAKQMQAAIVQARDMGDSLGGAIEVAACGLPVGLGEPWFWGAESALSSLFFSIPAVKSVEFGLGSAFAEAKGSKINDIIKADNGKITIETNYAGGINGGLTNGNPIVARLVFRPTPSIALPQQSVSLKSLKSVSLEIKGRNDPSIVSRAAAIVEAAMALGVADLLLASQKSAAFNGPK